MKIYIDLSNLMLVDFVTGIQRVVREITARIVSSPQHEFVLMTYSFRKNAFMKLDTDLFRRHFTGEDFEKELIYTQEVVEIDSIPCGAVFFDIDSVWNSRLNRSWLFPKLKKNGVKIVTELYDLIPITHPQFCHSNTTANFMAYVGANLKYADLIITNSNATVQALNDLTDKLGMERKNAIVVPLSSDFTNNGSSSSKNEVDPEVKEIADAGKYLLMLGTIEPRKNHSLVIDALESGLAEAGMRAIFAGRIGWNVEELEERMKNHELYGKSLFFVEKPDDSTVDYLYKNAFAVAFPTFNEGFGLPLIESFMRGTPVVASDITVLHEVAGDYADYFDPDDKDDFTRCVRALMDDPALYEQRRERLKSYVPYTWDESARDMLKAIETIDVTEKKVPDDIKIKQLVCLTARNDDMLATLPYIEEFMPFITEVVLMTPDKNVGELKSSYKGRLELKFLTDSQILNGQKLPEDHSTRNFFLRCLALKNDIFDDVFIMTDDDYRPLRTIGQDVFVKDGAYNAYYCYDLSRWRGTYSRPTSFDVCQRKTRKFLEEQGYPAKMYASHQMQVIDKRIFNEMTEKYPDIIDKGLCEWGTYFNYGAANYPSMFRQLPYAAMGWPGVRSDWYVDVVPEEFIFENHYSFLYTKGQVFEGLSEELCGNTREENVIKCCRFANELRKQREARTVYDSYSQGYWMQYLEIPSFTLIPAKSEEEGGEEKEGIAICAPAYFQAKAGEWSRIPFNVDKSIFTRLGTKDILLSYWFSDEDGLKLTSAGRMKIDPEDLSFLLPVFSPSCPERCVLNIKAILEDKDITTSVAVRANIIE